MDISAKKFKEKILDYNGLILLECWASWCLPCKQADDMLKKLSVEYHEKCQFFKINIDKNPTISNEFNVKGLPTFILFNKGKEVNRLVSSQSEDNIRNLINEVLESENEIIQEHKNNIGLSEEEEQRIIEERLKNLGYL